MIHNLLPLFMVSAFGASALAVGLIEDLAESTARIVNVFSGTLGVHYLSDVLAAAAEGGARLAL